MAGGAPCIVLRWITITFLPISLLSPNFWHCPTCCAICGDRFDVSRPRSRDYLPTGARDVISAVTWHRRCRQTFTRRRHRRRYRPHVSDTVRFIAVLNEHHNNDDDDDGVVERPAVSDTKASSKAAVTISSQLDTLHFIVVRVWILVDVLLLVRRLALTVAAVRSIHVQPPPPTHDVIMTSPSCVTWPPTVDQSEQPLAGGGGAGQNGGPYYVPPRPVVNADDVISGDVITTTSRDLGGSSPEVVGALGDVSLVYVALSVGGICLMSAAVCACAAVVDHFLSAVAGGSFLLPVSTYCRSAGELLMSEAQQLSADSVTAVEPRYELTSLQHIISAFSAGFNWAFEIHVLLVAIRL